MILINLLPHREERRRRRKQAFFVGIGLAVLLWWPGEAPRALGWRLAAAAWLGAASAATKARWSSCGATSATARVPTRRGCSTPGAGRPTG